MKGIWQAFQIWFYKNQLRIVTNALHQPKGKGGSYLAFMSFFFCVITPVLVSIVFLFAFIFATNSEFDSPLNILVSGLTLLTSVSFLFLMLRGYLLHKRFTKNGDLNEVEIWELQNKTQAKLKAFTDA